MENGDVDLKRLSLIDVSFEDDCLIDSPFTQSPFQQPSPSRPHLPAEEQGFDLVGVSDTNLGRKSVSFFDQDPKSSEREGSTNCKKFNLRTSLAWDSEFFTSAGVLEPDELTSMIEDSEKMENHALPRILEETQRSTDSISSLASDSLTIASDSLTVASVASAIGGLQVEFFEDIRASIQKSSRAFIKNSSGKAVPDSQTHQSSKKTDLASNGKLKPKPASKTLSAVMAKSGKSTNKVPVHARSMQLDSLPSKPPKPGNPSPAPSFTKRDSVGAHCLKVEKHNAEPANSRRAPATKPQSRAPSSRYSSSSSASDKMEVMTSSVDSSVSGSSTSTEKTPMSSIKRNDDTKPKKLSSVRSGLKTPAHLLPTIKLSSSCLSHASSISDFSSESPSSTSTPKQRSTIGRASIGTGSQKVAKEGSGVPHVSNSSRLSNAQQKDGHKTQGSSAQSSVRSASTGTMATLPNQLKPSGLRMPSPKIGFFDGAKSGRTPNGSRQTPHATSGLPKIGAEIVGVGGCINKVKVGKPQSARSSITNGSTRSRFQETSSSSSTEKVSGASRFVKRSPGISAKGQTNSSPNVEGTQPMVEEVKSSKCNGNITEAGTEDPLLKVKTSEDPLLPPILSTAKTDELVSERMPFFAVDSLCNIDSSSDVSAEPVAPQVEKRIESPSLEGPLDEKSQGHILI